MNELLARATGIFVAPATPIASRAEARAEARPEARAASVPAERVLVLGPAAAALPVAASLAGELAVRSADGAALLCGIVPEAAVGGAAAAEAAADAVTPDSFRPGPATGRARRLATRLEDRAMHAVARGRVVWLAPAGAAGPALVSARRAAAAVSEPVVVAVCGPRPEALVDVLDEQDLIVLAAVPAAREDVLALAVGELERVTPVRVVVARPSSRAGRSMAMAGWGRLRTADPELRGLVRGLA